MTPRLGDILVEKGLLTAEALAEALASARAKNEQLVRILLREGRAREEP